MARVDKLFRTAVQYNASDLYLTTGCKPVVRINGDLIIVDEHPVLTKKAAEEYLLEIMTEDQQKKFAQYSDLDFGLEVEGIARFRVNVFVQHKGIGAVFRLIPENVKSLDELGLPEQLKKLATYPSGLVLVCGPTGSGKSTTLAAILNEINIQRADHVITIEDPIEFIHTNKKSLIEQREVGSHAQSFQRALRASLREDTDVVLVGEMRDLETIALAITAAETGHLVLATLHTSGAAKSIDRIIDVFPHEQQNQIRIQLAESLKAVIWQTLIKTKDGKGRVGALEMLFSNPAVSNLIRKGNTHQINSVIETRRKEGMQTMKRALEDLVVNDIITEEAALEVLPPEEEV